jgi:hypothetical protein
MSGKMGRSDARLTAARYQVERMAPGEDASGEPTPQDDTVAAQPTMAERAQYVEVLIQQAMRRGDFDDLPGAGKPLTGLQQTYDPDWWIRQKIEREKITGLGPPALTLRTEDAALDDRLDAAASESAVRGILEDFNQAAFAAMSWRERRRARRGR